MRTSGDLTGSTWRRGLVLLLIGYLVVLGSLALAYQGPQNEFTGPPTCDGEAMSPGDRCVTFRVSRSGADSSSQTYEEALASQRDRAKLDPWMWGTILGTVGTVLIFSGAGRGLTAYERSGREVFTRVVATAAVPLLVVSGVVGWLELRYDRDLRDRSPLLLMLPGEVPGASLLMVALVALATAITYAGVRSSYQTARRQRQWRAESEARLRGPGFAPPGGSPFQEFFQQSAAPGGSPGQAAGGATPTAGSRFQEYFQEFFQQPSPTGAGQPASATTAGATTAGAGAAGAPPARQREQPALGPYDTPIGLLRVGQLLASVGSALWIGSLSAWHWGCVLLVLVGGAVVTLMGVEHAPRVRLAFQFVLVAFQAGAVGLTVWIGGLSDWHSGIIAGVWGGTAAVTYATATVTQRVAGRQDRE